MDSSVQPSSIVHLQTRFTIKTKNLSYTLSPIKYDHFNWDSWQEDGSYNVNQQQEVKYILRNVNCEAKPGEMTAIAGPSGAGKTTLLEILAGSIPQCRVIGKVVVNDEPVNSAYFRKLTGYVRQDEALFPLLTVEETLMYSARLRLQGGNKEVKGRVEKLLKELWLDNIASVRIGSESKRGISGGEKRRVSIGAELVHNPAIVLIDEPTSGLDSASAFQVMLMLKSLAKNHGKTIILSIHQPGYRILELIDKVVLLSDGFVLHNGSLSMLEDKLNAVGHFIPHGVNVLEFAIDVSESLFMGESDIESCETEGENTPTEDSISNVSDEEKRTRYPNSMFKEVMILAQRFSKNIFRTKELFAARTIQAFLAGILLGTIFLKTYSNSNNSKMQSQMGFFAFSLAFLLSSTTEALPIFLEERRILMRETSWGAYRISSYIIANTIIFLPFLLLVALLFSTPVYWLVGLRKDIDGFLFFSLVAWMVVATSNSFVACFSALVPNYISGMSLIAAIMGSFFLFSGYFISQEDTPVCWRFMHYLSLFKYPFESFLINEFGGEKRRTKCVESAGGICLVNAQAFLSKLGIDESKKWNNLAIMLGFIIGYRFVCFLILWFRCYRKRN